MVDYDLMDLDELLQAEREHQAKEPRLQLDIVVSVDGLSAMHVAQERWEAEMARIAKAKPSALRRKRRLDRERRRLVEPDGQITA